MKLNICNVSMFQRLYEKTDSVFVLVSYSISLQPFLFKMYACPVYTIRKNMLHESIFYTWVCIFPFTSCLFIVLNLYFLIAVSHRLNLDK
jgi:hypothetical protein